MHVAKFAISFIISILPDHAVLLITFVYHVPFSNGVALNDRLWWSSKVAREMHVWSNTALHMQHAFHE